MAEEAEVTPGAEKTVTTPVKMIALLLVGAVVLVALSVGGMFLMLKATGMLNPPGEDGAAAAKVPASPAVYHPLDPAFVVNINDNGRMRYLQVTMEVMTRDSSMVDEIKKHMPLIRNNLVLLLSSQTVASLQSAEGKESVRLQALTAIQNVLQAEIGVPGIEAVYITSMVIQ